MTKATNVERENRFAIILKAERLRRNMSLEEMAESENCENDSDGVMPEAMTVVWILVDAEDCETCYDCG